MFAVILYFRAIICHCRSVVGRHFDNTKGLNELILRLFWNCYDFAIFSFVASGNYDMSILTFGWQLAGEWSWYQQSENKGNSCLFAKLSLSLMSKQLINVFFLAELCQYLQHLLPLQWEEEELILLSIL